MRFQGEMYPGIIGFVISIPFYSHIISAEIKGAVHIGLVLVVFWVGPNRIKIGIVGALYLLRTRYHIYRLINYLVVEIIKLHMSRKSQINLLKNNPVSQSCSRSQIMERHVVIVVLNHRKTYGIYILKQCRPAGLNLNSLINMGVSCVGCSAYNHSHFCSCFNLRKSVCKNRSAGTVSINNQLIIS